VDCSILDKDGNRWWKQTFLVGKPDLEENIPWKDFTPVLSRILGWDEAKLTNEETKLDQLKPYLCYTEESKSVSEKPVERVTMQNFDRTLQWFGPFYLKEYAENILKTVHGLHKKGWYHGLISKEEASRRLETRPPGTYLLRLSMTSLGKPYTLSIISTVEIAHRRIGHVNHADTFSIRIHNEDRNFPTLLDLVEGCKGILNLKQECPTTPGRTSNYL